MSLRSLRAIRIRSKAVDIELSKPQVAGMPSLRSLRETMIKKGSRRARKEENTQRPQRK